MPRHNSNYDSQVVVEGKVMALLSYLSILCIIPLLFQKQNPFVLQHGKQGLVIFVGEVAVFILSILLGEWILRLGFLFLSVLSFVGIVSVLQGRYTRLPVAGKLAETITL